MTNYKQEPFIPQFNVFLLIAADFLCYGLERHALGVLWRVENILKD